ncbi:MAG: hypothetical protein J6V32_05200 [Elusimicrobiaceae bacterium]|nr:hypothetical protein [Elusimicrobiaceae bacterium]
MQLKTAFLSFALLICPCALCYGQLSFLGVNGERGYSAMRTKYELDLDNNFIFVPSYEFYRQSDDPDVEKTGSTYRYGLKGAYDFSDRWLGYTGVFWQPWAVDNEAASVYLGGLWRPFYRLGIIKEPFADIRAAHANRRCRIDSSGARLPDTYQRDETSLQVLTGAKVGFIDLEAAWYKVIQYSNPARSDISFSWADIPFMTAVVQGSLRQATAVQIGIALDFITPYASVVRYEYAEVSHPAMAVRAGAGIKWEEVIFAGGVEVFEPRREEERKTFFSMSIEINF